MKQIRAVGLGVLMAVSLLALAQDASKKGASNTSGKNADLEKVLAAANEQWLCAGPYYKAKAQDCVDSRAKFWADQFFEIYPNGQVQTKAEMVVSQTEGARKHPNVVAGEGPNPTEFKLMALYGNVALGVDRTIFKAPDASSKLATTSQARVLRIFVKENGKWRPAAAALITIPPAS
jgi:uncharacterized protein DUF4440